MSPVWIRRRTVGPSKRTPKARRSYQVLYRRGGRFFPIQSAGTFPTEREARLRRDLVAGWLAAGLNPSDEFARIQAAAPTVRTLTHWAAAFLDSRIDVGRSSHIHDRSALAKLTAAFGGRLPESILTAELQGLVNELADTLEASTLRTYRTKWAMLFAYAGVDPNPATDKHLRLPKPMRKEINPPTADHFLAAIRIMPRKYPLPLVTLEQTAMRIGEAESLEWGDVDEQGGRFRLRGVNVKTSRPRWVEVPEWLMHAIAATVPVEDRAETRRVFQGFTGDGARAALRKACLTAGVPVFTPHDLRHRRTTIWHHDGVPIRVLMERGGWTKSEIPLEVYSHLMPLAEAPREELAKLVSVMPR